MILFSLYWYQCMYLHTMHTECNTLLVSHSPSVLKYMTSFEDIKTTTPTTSLSIIKSRIRWSHLSTNNLEVVSNADSIITDNSYWLTPPVSSQGLAPSHKIYTWDMYSFSEAMMYRLSWTAWQIMVSHIKWYMHEMRAFIGKNMLTINSTKYWGVPYVGNNNFHYHIINQWSRNVP